MDHWSLNEALVAAVTADDCVRVRELLSQGADPNGVRGPFGHPALHLAAERGQTELVNLLIEAGARVEGDSELWPPVANGYWDTAHALLAHGASIELNPAFSNCGSLLFAALGVNPFLRLFLKLGADVEARIGPWGNTVLFDAAEGSHGNLQVLIDAGADPNARNDEGETVLMWAARTGEVRAVETLLRAGADPNVFNEQGSDEMVIASTALTCAIESGGWKVVEALLTGGAEINQRDTLGRSPLMLAAECMPRMLGCLIAEGADVSATDRKGLTTQQRMEDSRREWMRQLGAGEV